MQPCFCLCTYINSMTVLPQLMPWAAGLTLWQAGLCHATSLFYILEVWLLFYACTSQARVRKAPLSIGNLASDLRWCEFCLHTITVLGGTACRRQLRYAKGLKNIEGLLILCLSMAEVEWHCDAAMPAVAVLRELVKHIAWQMCGTHEIVCSSVQFLLRATI